MNFEKNVGRKGVDLGGEWIGIAVLLMIPYLRIIGLFMLVKQAGKLFNFRGRGLGFVYLIAALLFAGSIGEVVGNIATMIIPLTIAVVAFIVLASFTKNKQSKLGNYVACIGDSASYSIDDLMSEMGVTEDKLRKDIAELKKKNMLPKEAYIDEGHRLLVLRREGKPASSPRGAQAANARPQPQTQKQPAYEASSEYQNILLEIRALNVAIDDEEVSAKIDRIEEITANIFHLVEQKPERKNDIQTFMEYYLPTTLKLLRQYARLEHQPTSGENVTSTRARIESILNKLVAGFEKQLDLLFKSDAIDITSDIKVLEKMMDMDGLSAQ